MPSEVTKKDLQSLQDYVNKKIAELDSKLAKGLSDEAAKRIKAIDQANEVIREANKSVDLLSDLQAVVNEHAKAIKALEKAGN